MKKIMNKTILCCVSFCFFFLFIYTSKAQNNKTGITVKMDGYIINLGGEIIFQPCEDSIINVWDAMDNTSFAISCNSYVNEYCEAIDKVGDSLVVQCRDWENSSIYNIKISFFYCSLDINMQFLAVSENDFKVYKHPQYEILYNQKKYPLRGFYIRNRINKLIPHSRKNLLLMYHYYADKKHTVPQWLEKLVKCKAKK